MKNVTFYYRVKQRSDIPIAFIVLSILLVMVIPLPTWLISFLIVCNFTASFIILMMSLYTFRPLDFSVFPSLLLILTLFRLSLNISSTRSILWKAEAGAVINAFGHFVVRGDYVIGFVVFLLLVVIQFVVITKGASRIAEVAARFNLDAMPGKQMSIDADLNAGLITEEAARRRREIIAQEADFYGAMDGASKFVRGDAVAGIIITIINILGGFIIGTTKHQMPLSQSAVTYTILTIGDGLVSQIPALIISTAAGIVVTRGATSDSDFGRGLSAQIFAKIPPIAITSVILAVLAIALPGWPTKLPFALLSGATGLIAYRMLRRKDEPSEIEYEAADAKITTEDELEEEIRNVLHVHPMEIMVGFGLLPIVSTEQPDNLSDKISRIRREFAIERGFQVPKIRVRDNAQLKSNQYAILIKGIEVASGELMLNQYLAMNPGGDIAEIEGIEVNEPVFGLEALWITKEQKEEAEIAGYTVVDAVSVMATHIKEVIKAHAHELMGRQEVRELLDKIKEDHPVVVEELVPDILSVGIVQKVLQNLLSESVSIRDSITILETLADYGPQTKDVIVLTEAVREALARHICQPYIDEDGTLSVLTLDEQLEALLKSQIIT
ncbi:TPA: flagellar biosynthesis protein FlhA, partial [Candidatus Poribacteria bacterium]|nr:flagellar biosynthesis protein FlhA [Candidatus Poribacteria bacterium]